MLTLSDNEEKVIKEFFSHFKFSLAAFLTEKPRPEGGEYRARLPDDEARELWHKLGLGEWKGEGG